MALSRFWSFILASSVVYLFYLMLSGQLYSLNGVVNGSQNDPLLVSEYDSGAFAASEAELFSSLKSATSGKVTIDQKTYKLTDKGVVEVYQGKLAADGIFMTCKNTVIGLWLPLIGYLTFFCGLMQLLSDSNATEKLARFLTPVFSRIFPDLPKGHPAYGFMTMNFAANFLGLDNAATPFGLKAMESMQEVNKDKNRASNSQIMFLCLHAAGLTLLPTSIIGYRAAQGAANPSDVMLPIIITSFVGTIAALIFVSIRQRINLLNGVIILSVTGISAVIGLLLFYIVRLEGITKIHFTDNLSNGILLLIILTIVFYAMLKEQVFRKNGTNLFDSFAEGAKEGFTTGVRVLPYIIAMLVVLSIFRNSGLMDIVMKGLTAVFGFLNVDKEIIDAIPVALMRPFSAGGSRGFMLDAMAAFGADSLTGRLACLFQGAAETTFYVIALYFGSVNVKEIRYTLGIMLLVDLVCVITAAIVTGIYFS
ncbi:MAG: spore maturation protein [Bacteroidia bacterium]|nr:spore maturation protein [Bacteroidia bacterium]MCZ2278040.1 spore maturation protein [Bacteroidia bacterium]